MLFWGIATGAPFNGWLSSQIQNKDTLKLGICSCATMLAILYITDLSPWNMSLLMYATGFFMSSQSLIFVFAKNIVSYHLTATAIATANMIVNMSSYIQPLIGSNLARYHILYKAGSMHYGLKNWQSSLVIIPIMLFGSFILSFFLNESDNKE